MDKLPPRHFVTIRTSPPRLCKANLCCWRTFQCTTGANNKLVIIYDVSLANGANSINVTLCGTLCLTAEVGNSYLIAPVKFRTNYDNRYLTRSPSTGITVCDAIPILYEVITKSQDMTVKTAQTIKVLGHIVSIMETKIMYSCPACERSVILDETFAEQKECKNCNLTTLSDFCEKEGLVKNVLKTTDSP